MELKKYRFSSSVPHHVPIHVHPMAECYILMTQPMGIIDSDWTYVTPGPEHITTSLEFVDPNILNKKHELPPLYATFPLNNEEEPREWIVENFSNLTFEKDEHRDFVFIGEFNGYNEEKSELSEKTDVEEVPPKPAFIT